MQMAGMKVKNESEFKLDPRREAEVVKQIRMLAVVSLPTLQRLYKECYGWDASECDDGSLLCRKLQYWLQWEHYLAINTPMSDALRKKCRAIMAMPITPGGPLNMPKSSAVKKAAPVVEEVEEVETEETEEEEEGEEAEEATEESEPAAEKRPGVKRDGSIKVVSVTSRKGNKYAFKGKFLYEVLPGLLALNAKIKLSDHVLAEAIRKAWAGTGMNYLDKRIRGERIMYNQGKIKGMTGVPAVPLKEYSDAGAVVTREIPKQLQGFVKKGQSVKQTIAENKKKAKKGKEKAD